MKLAGVVPFIFCEVEFQIINFSGERVKKTHTKINRHWVHIDHRDFLKPDA